MPTPTTAHDFTRLPGKKLRWYSTRGPAGTRELAQAEIARRLPIQAAKAARKAARTTTPAQAKAPAKGVTRMGEFEGATVADLARLWELVKSN